MSEQKQETLRNWQDCQDCTFSMGRLKLCPLHFAAPELLAAAKAALPVVKWYMGLLEHPDNRAKYQAIVEQLETAITKAEQGE